MKLFGLMLLLPLFAGLPVELSAADETAEEKPYSVSCEEADDGTTSCTADKDTYIGWRTYHSVCNHCHGQDALGSSFAPSLVNPELRRQRFVEVVQQGFTGQLGVMPGFAENPNVNTRIDALYAYIRARSDGVLPPGRPQRAK